MNIVVLHNAVNDQSSPDERDVLVQAEAVFAALVQLGHEPNLIDCNLNLEKLREQLDRLKPDLVFNLVESLNGSGRLIHLVPFLLDSMGIRYTGAPAEAVYSTSNKVIAKSLLLSEQLPTPIWAVLDASGKIQIRSIQGEMLPVEASLIVKSVWEHASLGLDSQGLVPCTQAAELDRILRQRAAALGGSCFAERYVEGREFNLSLLAGPDGPQVLAPAEILFENYASDRPRIVCYRAKWDEDSFEYHHTPRRFEFPEKDHTLLQSLKSMACRCWHLFGLKGYARVDFRVDDRNQIWILEVNTNPCLAPDAGFYAALEQTHITFEQAIARIIADVPLSSVIVDHNAIERSDKIPATHAIESFIEKDHILQFRRDMKSTDSMIVRQLTEDTGFFNPMEVDVAVELVQERLEKGTSSGYHFIFGEYDGVVAGYACFGPIPCTEHSFDLYWIVVHPDFQRRGIGQQLMQTVELSVSRSGGRQLYIETSQRPLYEPTRTFYRHCGFEVVTILPDFYSSDDGKVIFYKKIV